MSVLPAAPHQRELRPVSALVVALVLAATATAGDADWSGLVDFSPDGWPGRRRRK